MTQKQEVQIAFAIWELLAQLDSLLWDRYFDEFNTIMYELEKKTGNGKTFSVSSQYKTHVNINILKGFLLNEILQN